MTFYPKSQKSKIMKKEERLDYLKNKKKWINENIMTIDDLYELDSFVSREIANEEYFMEKHPEMGYSFMVDRLKNVKTKLNSATELLAKNKSKRAFDPFETAFRHLNQDYDFIIGVFKSKNDL